MKSLLLIAALMAAAAQASSQSVPLTWSGQLRLRGEIDGRDFKSSNAYNAYALSRIRLGVNARPVDDVSIFLQVQDSRVFGEERDPSGQFSTLSNARNLDLYQGYVQIDRLFADPLSIRAGRTQLKYGNERLLGATDWHNVGRSFDGVVARYAREKTFVDAFAMITGETSVPPTAATPASVAGKRDEGQALYGVYGSFDLSGAATLDAFAFYQTNLKQTTPNEYDLLRLTTGLSGTLPLDAVTVELEGAYQGGEAGTKSVSAYLLAGAVAYRTGWEGLSSIRGSVEALSGTPEGDAGAKTFDPPFSTGHKFHGWMDYFINIPAQTFDRGLLDINAAAAGKLSDQLDWLVRGHSFSLMQTQNGETALGQEIDMLLTWTHSKPLAIGAGGGAFIPGVLMREAFGGSDVALWGYLSATVTF